MTNLVNAQSQGLYAQGNPPYTEVTRQGSGFNVSLASAAAPLNAIPTTVAGLEIFNNTAGNSAVTLVIDSLFAFELASTNFVRSYAIWAMVTTQKVAPTLTALDIFSHSGRAKTTTTATSRIITGAGTTVVANGWRPWGPVDVWGPANGGVVPGESLEANVGGRLIVPPNCSLCIHVAGALATGTFTMGASWYELAMSNVV